METYECWKCKEGFELFSGRISHKGNFTCYSCLKEWTKSMKPIWRADAKRMKEEEMKKRVGQMDLFEVAEALNTIF